MSECTCGAALTADGECSAPGHHWMRLYDRLSRELAAEKAARTAIEAAFLARHKPLSIRELFDRDAPAAIRLWDEQADAFCKEQQEARQKAEADAGYSAGALVKEHARATAAQRRIEALEAALRCATSSCGHGYSHEPCVQVIDAGIAALQPAAPEKEQDNGSQSEVSRGPSRSDQGAGIRVHEGAPLAAVRRQDSGGPALPEGHAERQLLDAGGQPGSAGAVDAGEDVLHRPDGSAVANGMGVGGNPTQIVAGASRNASSRTESVALPMGAPSINHHASPYAPLHESSRPPEFAAPALKDGAAPAQSVQVGGCTHLFCHGGRHYTIHDEPPSSRDAGPCPAATPCRECGGSGDGEMCGFCVRCNGSGVEPVLDAENPPPAAPAALGQAQPGPWCQKHGDRCCCEPDHDGPCMYASGKAIPEKPKTLSEGEAGPRLGICMKHGGDLHAERPECMLWAAAAPIPEKPSPAVPGEEDLRIAWDLCPIYQKHDFGLPCRECHRIAAKLARIRADEREALASMFASGNLSLPWRADEIAAAIRSRGSRR